VGPEICCEGMMERRWRRRWRRRREMVLQELTEAKRI